MPSAEQCSVTDSGGGALESCNPRRSNGKFTVTTEVPRPRCNEDNYPVRVSCSSCPRSVSFSDSN
jgi:hypothetical protein